MAKPADPTVSDFGQLGPASKDQVIQTPWMDGSWPITQGWGPSPYDLEPKGHGFSHWHAGVDIGCDCGTQIHTPLDFGSPDGLIYISTVVRFNNPGGYGTGLLLQVSHLQGSGRGFSQSVRDVDIYLGHLRQYLTPNGINVGSGTPVAVSNNTGNSTGCHLHFEVRPPGGRYGTDIDPAPWILFGAKGAPLAQDATDEQNPYNPITEPSQWLEWQITHDIKAPLQKVGNELLGIAQAGLGSAMMLGGFVMTGAGMRGMSAGQLGSAARRTLTAPGAGPTNLRKPAEPEAGTAEPTDATVPLSPQEPQPVEAQPKRRFAEGELEERIRSGQSFSKIQRSRSAGVAPAPRTPAERAMARRSRIRQSHQGRVKMPAR